LVLVVVAVAVLWLAKILVFNNALLTLTSSVATRIDFALLVLLGLDLVFLAIAEGLVKVVR
jgi:hypothetical protein